MNQQQPVALYKRHIRRPVAENRLFEGRGQPKTAPQNALASHTLSKISAEQTSTTAHNHRLPNIVGWKPRTSIVGRSTPFSHNPPLWDGGTVKPWAAYWSSFLFSKTRWMPSVLQT
jgi:hypothetical protein